MDTKRFFLGLLSMSLLFTSVTAFSQNYQVVEKQYFPSAPITDLIVDGDFSVEFITGARPSVTVIGDIDVAPSVKVTEVVSKDDETVLIKVSSDNGKNASKCKLIVEGVKGESLRIELSGMVSFETKNPMETDELAIIVGGSSSVNVNGTFQSVLVDAMGASVVHIIGTAQSVVINASGVSEVDISKLEYREAEINTSDVSHVSAKEDADNNITISGVSSISAGNKTIKEEKNDTHIILLDGNVIIKTAEGNDSTAISIIEDRVMVKNGVEKETITIGPYDIHIKQNKAIKIGNSRKNKFDGHWGGVEIGINGYNTSDFNMNYPQEYKYLDLYFPKSIAFYLNLLELNVPFSKNQKWGMLSGLGFEWHNYRFAHDVWLDTHDDILQGYYIDATSVKKTKLTVSYMTVPLIFEFQTNNKTRSNSFHVGLGVVGGLRIGSHTKVKFENKHTCYKLIDANDPLLILPVSECFISNKQKMKKYDDFYLNPLKLDVTARIGWSWINLFATYSLTPMFREHRAPELYPWSVGITLLGW